ncbi:hypothetical protein KDL44_03710 [bacterium]|nr:hypothetical protein [bacterium]
MTNLLRKFAEMFVEFDDDGKPAASASPSPAAGRPPTSGEDVLAAIEKIRTDLESEGHTDFEEAEDILDPGLLASHRERSGSPAADKPETGMKINIGNPPEEAPAAPRGSAPLAEGSASINVPKLLSIPEVYIRAQISNEGPGHVDRISEMLDDPELEGLPMDIRARSVKMALKATGIGMESILEDAGRRDQALEDYNFYLEKKLEQIRGQVEADNQRLQQEIDEFVKQKQELMQRNRVSLEEAGRIREEFRKAKQAEEKRLYDIVTPFVSPGENPVELT